MSVYRPLLTIVQQNTKIASCGSDRKGAKQDYIVSSLPLGPLRSLLRGRDYFRPNPPFRLETDFTCLSSFSSIFITSASAARMILGTALRSISAPRFLKCLISAGVIVGV